MMVMEVAEAVEVGMGVAFSGVGGVELVRAASVLTVDQALFTFQDSENASAFN